MRGGELIGIDLLLHQLPPIIHLILLRIGFWKFDKTMIPMAIIINLIYFLVYLMQVNPYKIYLHKQ
jgi:hypothetical protein